MPENMQTLSIVCVCGSQHQRRFKQHAKLATMITPLCLSLFVGRHLRARRRCQLYPCRRPTAARMLMLRRSRALATNGPTAATISMLKCELPSSANRLPPSRMPHKSSTTMARPQGTQAAGDEHLADWLPGTQAVVVQMLDHVLFDDE
jgi:hypothetical protein